MSASNCSVCTYLIVLWFGIKIIFCSLVHRHEHNKYFSFTSYQHIFLVIINKSFLCIEQQEQHNIYTFNSFFIFIFVPLNKKNKAKHSYFINHNRGFYLIFYIRINNKQCTALELIVGYKEW